MGIFDCGVVPRGSKHESFVQEALIIVPVVKQNTNNDAL